MPCARAAETNQASQAEINAASDADYKRTLELLGITSMRPGHNAVNTNSPNYANYIEARANVYTNLPDPLILNDGKKVTTAKMWRKLRRPEIVSDFDQYIYGVVPSDTPKVNWEVVSVTRTNNGDVPVITKQLVGHVDNSSDTNITVNIQLTLTTPANAKGPVPVIMQLTFVLSPAMLKRLGMLPDSGPTWQQQVLARGWGYASLIPTSIQPDNGAGLTSGIIGLCNHGQPRTKPNDWGALRAWAWGTSRALDYFETDKDVDARRVGIEGHSRYGKASLVAMAYDPRFAIGYISSSGAGGAKILRRNFGEVLENVAGNREYHWMAPNFLKYAGPLDANDMPVDGHELIALCAPRPVFIGGGTVKGDGWADPQGMFMAAAAASPVYELLGKKGLGTTNFPPITTALVSGDIAFRQHTEGHTDGPNWPYFLISRKSILAQQIRKRLDSPASFI
jgi:hypothetical protein